MLHIFLNVYARMLVKFSQFEGWNSQFSNRQVIFNAKILLFTQVHVNEMQTFNLSFDLLQCTNVKCTKQLHFKYSFKKMFELFILSKYLKECLYISLCRTLRIICVFFFFDKQCLKHPMHESVSFPVCSLYQDGMGRAKVLRSAHNLYFHKCYA